MATSFKAAHYYYNRRMSKSILAGLALLILELIPITNNHKTLPGGHALLIPEQSSVADVISGVNALRAAHGLAAFQTNSILMGVCQAQADYMASIGTYSDTDAQGRGTLARVQAAGYPASRASENVYEGDNATAADAINFWTGDAMHRIALFDPGLTDIGAGVAVSGSYYFYCQVAALSGSAPVNTGGSNSPSTDQSIAPIPPVHYILVATPGPDGSIVHIVQSGDTLLGIAQAYGVPVTSIELLNTMTGASTIFPGDKLVIRPADTPSAVPSVEAEAAAPTSTPLAAFLSTATQAESSPTGSPAPGIPTGRAGITVAVIALIALICAGAITVIGARDRG